MPSFNEISQDERDALQYEFDYATTSKERRIEILNYVQEGAAEAGEKCCVFCKKPIIFIPHTEALIPGHVYSAPGLLEVRITGICEYCFDKATKEPDEDE